MHFRAWAVHLLQVPSTCHLQLTEVYVQLYLQLQLSGPCLLPVMRLRALLVDTKRDPSSAFEPPCAENECTSESKSGSESQHEAGEWRESIFMPALVEAFSCEADMAAEGCTTVVASRHLRHVRHIQCGARRWGGHRISSQSLAPRQELPDKPTERTPRPTKRSRRCASKQIYYTLTAFNIHTIRR